jgi:ABC-type nitrate/sulfonate/bicarbonate transport system substrate-binding protein
VLGGEAPIASNSLEPTIHAAASGGEIVIIGSNLNGIAMSAIAQPSIRTPQDLRGKRMGVTAYASPTHTGAVLYLRSQGLDPQRDVPVTPIGGMPEIRGALESGALESAMITPPLSFALVRAGFTELADLSKLGLKYQQGALVTTRSYLRQQPDVARAFGQLPLVTKAVAGVGRWEEGQSTLYDSASDEDRAALRDLGVCADISGVFVAADGRPVRTELADRMIAISAEQMRAIPEVIIVPYSVRKAPAVRAALRSGLVDGVVTHTGLARAVLDES